jgi:RNA polymerase sigma-70 factor (ECF subfamily)
MKGDAKQVRGPIPSLNDDGSPTAFARTSVCRSKTPPAELGNESIIDMGGGAAHYSIASDDRLLTTAQAGDGHAFGELCRRHSPVVKRRILAIVRNQEDAEDALQETLLRAYMHLDAFRRTCKFSTWLTSIGTNTALMILRKRRTRNERYTELLNAEGGAWEATQYVDPSPDPEGLHARHQMILLVRRELQRLRPAFRSVIEKYYGTECSVEESAKALAIPASTAKARLWRGKKILRSYLTRRGISDCGI